MNEGPSSDAILNGISLALHDAVSSANDNESVTKSNSDEAGISGAEDILWIKSENSESEHRVELIGNRWRCDCEDYLPNGKDCVHISVASFVVEKNIL